MALKAVLEALDDVAEPLREHYVKTDDGKFRLDATGLVPKEKLNEFRDNNTVLLNKVKEFETKYADLDPAEYKRLQALAEKVKKGGGSEEDIERAVEERVVKMRNDHAVEVNALKETNKQGRTKLERVLIDKELQSSAVAAGCVESALEDIVLRGRMTFVLDENDKVVPMKDGKVMYGADGEPLSMKGWMESLAKNAPHLFKGSHGGGANNNGDRRGPSGIKTKADFKTRKDKIDYITEHGLEKFEALPVK